MALDYLPSAILMPTHGAQSLPVTMTVMTAPAKHAAADLAGALGNGGNTDACGASMRPTLAKPGIIITRYRPLRDHEQEARQPWWSKYDRVQASVKS
jgi:hypothetical protein